MVWMLMFAFTVVFVPDQIDQARSPWNGGQDGLELTETLAGLTGTAPASPEEKQATFPSRSIAYQMVSMLWAAGSRCPRVASDDRPHSNRGRRNLHDTVRRSGR
jgi:hypothetical protein